MPETYSSVTAVCYDREGAVIRLLGECFSCIFFVLINDCLKFCCVIYAMHNACVRGTHAEVSRSIIACFLLKKLLKMLIDSKNDVFLHHNCQK